MVIIIDNKIGDIEEKLKYMPIQANGSEMRGEPEVAGQTVYVPIYSNIYAQDGKPFHFEASLSIRNLDPDKEITINSIRYFDTSGKEIKNYLEEPLRLKLPATAEFIVEQKKIVGRSGGKFIVEWVSDTKVNKPLIEAVMIDIFHDLYPAGMD
ncbi:MAG: DUF3124 domain-containing protein [Deltaproteobacteria bacterium]|nr:DUF3124 domain-containing protein [Deltaproteobacteria bacterium]